MHDLNALVKRLETEKQELQAAIEEADSALEQGDTKLQQALADQTELKAETEHRLAERESEFDTTRHDWFHSSNRLVCKRRLPSIFVYGFCLFSRMLNGVFDGCFTTPHLLTQWTNFTDSVFL